jgi:hypothetical protein
MNEHVGEQNSTLLIRVSYADGGSHQFESIKEFANEISRIEPTEVSSVSSATYRRGGDDDLRLDFTRWGGVSLTADSPDPVWVRGVAEYIGAEIEKGATPRYRPDKEPLRWEVKAFAVVVLALAVFAIWFGFHEEVGVGGAIFLAFLWLGFAVIGWPLAILEDRNIEYPHLDLVLVDSPPPAPPKEPSWLVKVERWIRARPLVNLTLAFLLGVGVNKISDMI